jgi:hypothetical protein
MSNLWIDIETCPTQDVHLRTAIRQNLKAPSNYKDPAKIEAWLNENEQAALDKTALDGLYGEVIAIAWAWDEANVVAKVRPLDMDDGVFISTAFTMIANNHPHPAPGRLPATWSGWNVAFDYRFLWKRCIKHGVISPLTWPHVNQRYPDVNDAMELWAGRSGDAKALGKVAPALLGEGKVSDSATLWHAWMGGDHSTVHDHAVTDLEQTRDLWERMHDV